MPVTTEAVGASAVRDVVVAAAAERPVVVPHRLPAELALAGALDPATVSVPDSWVCAFDGGLEPTSAVRPQAYGAVLPAEVDRPIVTRLYHVQHAAGLGAVTDAVFDPLERAWPADEPWLGRDAGVFVASDGAVTPAHADEHHNLLLQVSGTKTVALCPPGSRAHASRLVRSLPLLFVEEMPPGTELVTLEAGHALYLPPYSIHWVRSEAASVALSCGWSTASTVRAGEIYAAGSMLRRLGVPVQPVGGRSDEAKVAVAAAARRVRRVLRRG